MTTSRTVYVGRFISAPVPDELLIQTGAVVVSNTDGTGVIDAVDWNVKDAEEVREKFGHEVDVVVASPDDFFFPGFIDTHIHAPQYPNAGIFGKSTLLDWLTTYTFPLESSLGSPHSPMYASTPSDAIDPLARAKSVYTRVITRTLAHGTTTASYYATISVPATNLLASVAFSHGQRALIGRVCMDDPDTCPDYYRDGSTDATIAASKASIAYCRKLDPTGHLVAPIITPRFAPSCLPTTLSALGDLARTEDVRIQTHISENTNEVALVRQLFPEHEHYTAVYDHAGLLTTRTILAHAVHLSDQEKQVIKARGAKVSHCAASNSALGSGFCPVRDLLDAGIDVGLGTDVSGGFALSMLEAVRQACLVSRHVGFVKGGEARYNVGDVEALYLATTGGAKVVGLPGRLGGFEKGMWWDVQEVELAAVNEDGESKGVGEVDVFGWESWPDRVAKWVWNGGAQNVKRVWVGGRLVHERK